MTNLTTIGAGATVMLTGVFTLAYFVWRKAVRPAWRAFSAMLADWHGATARPGVPGRPGVMERLSALEGAVTEVRGELVPNGGSTIRDAVDRVENKLGTNEDAARNYRQDHP